MTKEEAVAKLHEQGYEVTPEEAKSLEALLSTGELDESALDKVVGGLDPRFKKALIGAGILIAAAAGVKGTYSLAKWAGKKRADAARFARAQDVQVRAGTGLQVESVEGTPSGAVHTVFKQDDE